MQLQQIISYDATNVKNVVKIYVPTWSIFAGPVTYVCECIFLYVCVYVCTCEYIGQLTTDTIQFVTAQEEDFVREQLQRLCLLPVSYIDTTDGKLK